jgi:predicted AAA+ superfamily ATPase
MAYKEISETLAGRVCIFELMPLTLKEMASKSGNIIDLLFEKKFSAEDMSENISDEDIYKRILAGCYPEILKIDSTKGRYLWFSSYVSTYIERDIRDLGEIRKLDKFIRMFNILASRSSNILNKSDISRDSRLDVKTVENYIGLLELVYQIHLLKPYCANIGKRFIKSPKIFFTDSGILSYLLGVYTPDDFLKSSYKGMIFETFVFCELFKGVKYLDQPSSLYYYRTHDKKEIDFVVERDADVTAIEVKLAKTVTKRDFRHILHLKENKKGFRTGIIFYMGKRVMPFGKDLFAVPVRMFF